MTRHFQDQTQNTSRDGQPRHQPKERLDHRIEPGKGRICENQIKLPGYRGPPTQDIGLNNICSQIGSVQTLRDCREICLQAGDRISVLFDKRDRCGPATERLQSIGACTRKEIQDPLPFH